MAAKLLLIALGGALGSVARYGIATAVARWLETPMPWGTAAVNLLGCLVFGVAFGAMEDRVAAESLTRALLFVGFFGGFTTFSSFGYETVALAREGAYGLAAASIVLQNVLGVLGMLGGWELGRRLL